eukprot:351454-Chlamydomonas_euryale.AAC.5
MHVSSADKLAHRLRAGHVPAARDSAKHRPLAHPPVAVRSRRVSQKLHYEGRGRGPVTAQPLPWQRPRACSHRESRRGQPVAMGGESAHGGRGRDRRLFAAAVNRACVGPCTPLAV